MARKVHIVLTSQEEQAVRGFLKLEDAEKKAVLQAKKLALESQQAGRSGKQAGDDMTGGFGQALGPIKNLAGALGIGMGLSGIITVLRNEISKTIEELKKFGDTSDKVLNRSADIARAMPGAWEQNKQLYKDIVEWSDKIQSGAKREDIESTIRSFVGMGGREATMAGIESITKRALMMAPRFDPRTYAGIMGGVAAGYGAEAMKKEPGLTDMVARIMEMTGEIQSQKVAESLSGLTLAKESGFSITEALALMTASAQKGIPAEMVLKKIIAPEIPTLVPRDIDKQTFRTVQEMEKYEQLKRMDEGKRMETLLGDEKAREAWFGRYVHEYEMLRYKFFGMKEKEERKAAILEGKMDLGILLGTRGGAAKAFVPEYWRTKQEMEKARGTDYAAQKVEEDWQSEEKQLMRRVRAEELAEERPAKKYGSMDLWRRRIESYQKEYFVEEMKLLGLDVLKIDPLTMFEREFGVRSAGGTRVLSEREMQRLALYSVHHPRRFSRYLMEQEGIKLPESEVRKFEMKQEFIESTQRLVFGKSFEEQEKQTEEQRKQTRAMQESNTLRNFDQMGAPLY